MLSIFMLLMLASLAYGQTNYCAFSPDHTMCIYPAKGCKFGLIASGISAADKSAILRIHNDLRRKVAIGQQTGQPSASNMRELKWDDEIATIAQRWSDQCTTSFDRNRKTAKYGFVNQCATWTSCNVETTAAANFTQATLLWYNEVTSPGFDPRNIKPYVYNTGYACYTQVVWAETDRIGCGYAYYKEGTSYKKLYHCNYAYGGNIKGNTMYNVGPAATACVGGRSAAYPGLCNS